MLYLYIRRLAELLGLHSAHTHTPDTHTHTHTHTHTRAHQHGGDVVETLLADIIGREVEREQPLLLFRHAGTDVAHASVHQVVAAHVQQPQRVVGAEDAAQVLPVLHSKVVVTQPQLL